MNHIHRCLLRCGKQDSERIPQECADTTSPRAHQFVILFKLRASVIEIRNRVVVWLYVFCSEARERTLQLMWVHSRHASYKAWENDGSL
jgi:hypothetical protein